MKPGRTALPPARPFSIGYTPRFLRNYESLKADERKRVDKCVRLLAANPRHPSLRTHKVVGFEGEFEAGGRGVFIAYASRELRVTFEYGPQFGMIAVRNCGHHDACERRM